MGISKIIPNLLVALASASFLVTAPALVHAGDACKNVKFKITNEHDSGKQIQLVQVKYYNKANGKWQTEDVKNGTCNQGSSCITGGDNLRDAEGEDLTKLRMVYKYKEGDGDWSDKVEGGDKVPATPECYANRTYGPFTIFGKG